MYVRIKSGEDEGFQDFSTHWKYGNGVVGGWVFSRFVFLQDWDHDVVFPNRWEVAGGVDLVVKDKESVLSPWSEVFNAVYGIVSRGFSLNFINGSL